MAPVNGDMVWRQLFVIVIVLSVLFVRSESVYIYSHKDLLDILATSNCECRPSLRHNIDEFAGCELFTSNRPTETGEAKHRRSIRKRGRRGGVLVRFRRRAHRPPLPAIILANVRSINNKTDELFNLLAFNREFKESSVLCLTETWLKQDKPDALVTPPGFTIHRKDRSQEQTGKSEGGGVCVMVNHRWCADTTIFAQSCSPLLEQITVNCRPFYSPREFSSFVIMTVYIPPDANASAAINELTQHAAAAESAFPDSPIIIAGDFNHTNLRKTLPRYYQHVDCPTREDKTLDHCYTTIKHAYRATPRAPLGDSDHSMVLLTPTYRQRLKTVKPVTKTVRRWTSEATEALRGCLETTDWSVFKESSSSLDEYADTVTSYVAFCENSCVPIKTVRVFGNNKPWFRRSVKIKLDAKNEAFKSGDPVQYREAKAELRREINRAKAAYRKKLEDQVSSNNTREVWRGLQQITNYKQKAVAQDDVDPELPDKLNLFYSRFDEKNPSPGYRPPPLGSASALTPPFTVQEAEVRRLFLKQNPRKASGPDNVSTSALRFCADQLAPVFTDIFNNSLQQMSVPRCFKSSVIVPVPKKSKVTQLNDFRPVALTSVAMKALERLVLRYLRSAVGHLLDPFQFAYQANRSVDDAVALGLHFILQHLEAPRTYARVLFIDYSSAFNTIIPHKLFNKLLHLNIHPSICHWIQDFLLDRPQLVRINGSHSTSLTLNTGAPQGCVLSPLLFTLFTNDCVSSDSSVKILKFSDDTTLIGLVSDGDESLYREEVRRMVGWCGQNDLELNVSKTKEVIIDFRRNKNQILPLTINGELVEQVSSFKFLGTTISSDLSWDSNVTSIVKKCQQRLHFLRQLRKFGMSTEILAQFYRAVIEGILCFSITVWYGNATSKERKQLERIVITASKIADCDFPSVASVFETRRSRKTKKIIRDPSHPANHLFELLPSGRRFRALKARTARFRSSFYPDAVLNSLPASFNADLN